MSGLNQRLAFADFLDRLASGAADTEQWQTFAVTHYFDNVLEEIRRRCVRVAIQVPERNSWSEEERIQLRAWARELRGSPLV
jgi:hypothetical protein